jgi:hypothetical protein
VPASVAPWRDDRCLRLGAHGISGTLRHVGRCRAAAGANVWQVPQFPTVQRIPSAFPTARGLLSAHRSMLNESSPARYPRPAYPRAAAVLACVFVLAGVPGPGGTGRTVLAQAADPCLLVTLDDIEPLAGNASVAHGVSSSLPGVGQVGCRYVWGAGVNRFALDVLVDEPSRIFPGMNPEEIKQRLLQSVRPGTKDEIVSDTGDAAVFTPDSPAYARATALAKNRIVVVRLDGAFASERKGQLVGLLKTAVSRL